MAEHTNIARGNARVGMQIGSDNQVSGDARVAAQYGYTIAEKTPHPGDQVCRECWDRKIGR